MTQRGTERYMAPEIYQGGHYGFQVDIYSLGLVLYQYLNENRPPFCETMFPIMIIRIRRNGELEATLSLHRYMDQKNCKRWFCGQ